MRVKILQWNIWFKEKVENIIEFIKETNPDILCLQELTINSEFNGNQDVPKIISQNLNFDYNFALAQEFENGNLQGNGIFSKYKIIENSNFFIAESKNSNDYSSEGRICAVSKIQLNNRIITIATTHSSYNHKFVENDLKLKEISKLTNFFKINKDIIFTGDLNITPNAESIKLIENELIHCGPNFNEPTWTTKPFSYNGFKENKLNWRLDYAFASKDIKVISSKILKTKYSDHLPILIEVEI